MEILLAILAALGTAVLLWCVAGLILLPVSGCDMLTLLRVGGFCPELECRVRGFLLLQRLGLLDARLVLVDCGMGAETAEIARRLAADHDTVELVSAADLKTYLDRVRSDDGTA